MYLHIHWCLLQDEKKRIEALGGCVVWYGAWRVNGSLSVSRAIGTAADLSLWDAMCHVTQVSVSGLHAQFVFHKISQQVSHLSSATDWQCPWVTISIQWALSVTARCVTLEYDRPYCGIERCLLFKSVLCTIIHYVEAYLLNILLGWCLNIAIALIIDYQLVEIYEDL